MPDKNSPPPRSRKDIGAGDLVAKSPPDPLPDDKADDELGDQLRSARRERLHERFVWIFVIILIFDFHVFVAVPAEFWGKVLQTESWPWHIRMQHRSGTLAFVLLQLLFLAILARKCEFPLAEAAIGRFSRLFRWLFGFFFRFF